MKILGIILGDFEKKLKENNPGKFDNHLSEIVVKRRDILRKFGT